MAGLKLYLASASARRKLLLEEAGFAPVIVSSGVDDGELRPGESGPDDWTTALAYLKASAGRRRLVRQLGAGFDGIVLGADTVVVKKGAVIGQPKDESDARRILELLEDGEHRVVSGVALLGPGDNGKGSDSGGAGFGGGSGREERQLLADVAHVRVGRIGGERIEAYLATGHWRGKAGGYNLSERVADGWPIECEGDPATVMGLPMRRLGVLLRELLGE